MKKYIPVLFVLSFLCNFSMVHAAWFVVAIDNNTDLTLIKAIRGNDIEIPSISQIFTKAINQHEISLSGQGPFGSLASCKIVAQDKQGQNVTFALFGDPAYRVANGRAAFADLDSRNAAATLLSSMMARVFMIRLDGTMQLVGFVGYEENNQSIALTLNGAAGSYQVNFTLVK